MSGLEKKFCKSSHQLTIGDGAWIEGYASVFGVCDQGGDIVERGAFNAYLKKRAAENKSIKLLWQHDPAQPIGFWEEVREDDFGLFVKGRLLEGVERGREAIALIEAGAIDGLSIGYRTVRAAKNGKGHRVLKELELWEVSLVTFPMLPSARVVSKGEDPTDRHWRELAQVLEDARLNLAGV